MRRMQEQTWTEKQIQGRLNQLEIPLTASIDAKGIVTFVPTKGPRGLRVHWDRALGPSLKQLTDWLRTFPY